MQTTSEVVSEPAPVHAPVINQIVARLRESTHKITVYGDSGRSEHSYQSLYARVLAAAGRLAYLLGGETRVGVVAENTIDFVVVDLACVTAGLCNVCIDRKATLDSDAVAYFDGLGVRAVLRREPASEDELASGLRIIAFAELFDDGESTNLQSPFRWRDEQLLTIKQTSGSTGMPKAIGARVDSVDDTLNLVQEMFGHGAHDRVLIFLPLYLVQQRYWIYSSIYFGFDVVLTSWRSVLSVLSATHPTVVMGVPKLYDILKDRIQYKAQLLAFGDADPVLGSQTPDDAALRAAARAVLGPEIRYLWTGSAPCSHVALEFFRRVGIPLLEGYGTNETDIISKNSFKHCKFGSVGKVLPNRRVTFSPAGQISVWRRYPVTTGYELGHESTGGFEGDVYVTGDLGYLDEEGYLYINGRVGDAFVLEGGTTIHPREIEMQLEQSDLINFAVVSGHNRPFLVAVVDPQTSSVDCGVLEQAVYAITSKAGSAKRVGRIVVSREPFSEENGCLSPQRKIVRRRILETYGKDIEACYTA